MASLQGQQIILKLGNGHQIPFAVEGRTPFEKRMVKEEEHYKQANSDEVVSIELYFHQFWRPLGHTSLRIGTHLYELSTDGWRVHCQGADNPRAFLFNNPFFRKQMNRFSKYGMKPLSLGMTLYLRKETADKIMISLQNKCAADTSFRRRERFNILTNNCNQGIMEVLASCGVTGFTSEGFEGFSSVLSFNKLLHRSVLHNERKVGYGKVRIYPLPGYEYSMTELQQWVYPWIYSENRSWKEAQRALPLYFHSYFVIFKSFLKSKSQWLLGH